MAEVLALLVGVIVVTAGGALIVLRVTEHQRLHLARSPAVALELGDIWYRHAVVLARLLEGLRRDDMVAVTIPEDLRYEIDIALKRFWNAQQG